VPVIFAAPSGPRPGPDFRGAFLDPEGWAEGELAGAGGPVVLDVAGDTAAGDVKIAALECVGDPQDDRLSRVRVASRAAARRMKRALQRGGSIEAFHRTAASALGNPRRGTTLG